MLRAFPQFTRAYVMDELPMLEGWALWSWAIENDTGLVLKRKCRGYVGQEIDRRMKEYLACLTK